MSSHGDHGGVTLDFVVHYVTTFGQQIGLVLATGQRVTLGYDADGLWRGRIICDRARLPYTFQYKYELQLEAAESVLEHCSWRHLDLAVGCASHAEIRDAWRAPGIPCSLFEAGGARTTLFHPSITRPKSFGSVTPYARGCPTATAVTVRLRVAEPRLAPGSQLVVCGSIPELGCWDPAKAQPMVPTSDGICDWVVDLQIPVSSFPFDYKYLVRHAAGRDEASTAVPRETMSHLWEDGPNRNVQAPEFVSRAAVLACGPDGSVAGPPTVASCAPSAVPDSVRLIAPVPLVVIHKNTGVASRLTSASAGADSADESCAPARSVSLFEPEWYLRRATTTREHASRDVDEGDDWRSPGERCSSVHAAGETSPLTKQQKSGGSIASAGSSVSTAHVAQTGASRADAADEGPARPDPTSGSGEHCSCIIISDSFVRFDSHPWRGAGVSVPLFSLRESSEYESWPVGDFVCIAKLVDWAKCCGFKVVHMLPVNDTGSVGADGQSSPFCPVSSCALHPAYINLPAVLEWVDVQAVAGTSLTSAREAPGTRPLATCSTDSTSCPPVDVHSEPCSEGQFSGSSFAESTAVDPAFRVHSPGDDSMRAVARDAAKPRWSVSEGLRHRVLASTLQSDYPHSTGKASATSRTDLSWAEAATPTAPTAPMPGGSSVQPPRVQPRGVPAHSGRGGVSVSSGASSRPQPIAAVDWDAVIPGKLSLLRDLYRTVGEAVLGERSFQAWFRANREWVQPYALFCFFRDAMGTTDPRNWGSRAHISQQLIQSLTDSSQFHFRAIGFWFFVQFFAHIQLERAAAHARDAEVMLVVDIPSGMPRSSADVWAWPQYFHLDAAMGAPPDGQWRDGQHWDYTPYNWSRMAADDYSWWRMRIRHMSVYFTGLRLSRVVEYFRTYAVPSESVTGLRGVFTPADGFTRRELEAVGLWDMRRLAEPYVREWTVRAALGPNFASLAPRFFVIDPASGQYSLRPDFDSEHKLLSSLSGTPDEWLVRPLAQLLHNVCLFATRPRSSPSPRGAGSSRLQGESSGAGLESKGALGLLPEHVSKLELAIAAGGQSPAQAMPCRSGSERARAASASRSPSATAVFGSDGAPALSGHAAGATSRMDGSPAGDAFLLAGTAPSSSGGGHPSATLCLPSALDDLIFHPRFDMHASTSFLECDEYTRRLLSKVHAVYFSERQQELWRTTGYLRLSALLRVCLATGSGGPALFADDLGPQQAGCRDTLRFLGILGTDSHRLPRHDSGSATASAAHDLSVVTAQFQNPSTMEYGCWAMPSTQDLPSLRQWWEEDTSMAWGYFRSCVAPQQMALPAVTDAASASSSAPTGAFSRHCDDRAAGGAGSAAAFYRSTEHLPKQCTSEIATALLRHYCASTAMLVVFPLQDVIAMDAGLRHPDPHERINIPTLAKHVWRWRIPVTLATLLSEPGRTLRSKLRDMLQEAARLGEL